ncbi:restriction endonuclease subunit S [Lacticaseibacillus rhamnosus]|uniref:restriction endonuclease subunit S n=1 Tax=Lacticaseibacillus rhamnosus TaxID=47715 RepID=UPI0009BA02D6|nr:restriction endonuclease subunit S [Lacticaseibacillus rhamnosus]
MAKIDDSVKKKVPELRFKGFTDPWVQRNLADLSDGFSYGLNAAAKEYDGVHGYLRITDVDEVSHSFLPEGLTSPDVPENQLTDYRMDEQSIVYARTGASTGKTYIYRDSDGELYYAGFLIRQKVNKETSAQFVYQNTLTKAWERYVQVMSQRSGQPGINAQEVGRFELTIPEKAEQDKIAHLFNSLDNLIAANQRKLDLLKEQKKGYLQKMFPKNGAKVPELRFAGFADAWEDRKLSDIADRFDNLRVPITASDRKPGDTPYYGANGIQDYVEGFTHNGEFILVAEDGANDLKNYPVQYVNGKVWVNNHAHVLQGKKTITDNKFLMNAIKNFNIEPFLVGGGRAKLNADVMMKLNILLPTFVEQEKIGSLFSAW